MTYTVTWETNFVPLAVEILDRSENGYFAHLEEDLGMSGSYPLHLNAVDCPLHIRAWYATGQSVASEEFVVSNDLMAFTTQPQTVALDPVTLQYTVSWETNFIPDRVCFIRLSDNQEIYSKAMTSTDGTETFSSRESGTTMCLRTYYYLGNYVESDSFTLADFDFHFFLQPQSGSFSASTLSYEAVWETNFVPLKVEVRCIVPSSSYEPLVDTIPQGSSFTGFYSFPFQSGSVQYRLYAYHNSTQYVTSEPFTVDDSAIRFTSQPQSGNYDPDTGMYYAQWGTTFVPLKVEIWLNNTLVETLDAPETALDYWGVHLDYDLPARWGEGTFRLRGFYGPGAGQCVDSAAFEVTCPGPMFILPPEDAAASAQVPGEIQWAISFDPTAQELWVLYGGECTKLKDLASDARSEQFTWEQAVQYQGGSFFVYAYYGDGEGERIESRPFRIFPRQTFAHMTIDALGLSHPFSEEERPFEEYNSYETYNDNVRSGDALDYLLTVSPAAQICAELWLWDEHGNSVHDENWDDYLYTEFDSAAGVSAHGLPGNVFTFRSEGKTLEIRVELATLRACYAAYAADHPELENPQLFSILLDVTVLDGGTYNYSFKLTDCHLPLEEYWPSIDYDELTLESRAFFPDLEFPAAAPAITSARNDWYTLFVTDGNEWDDNGWPIYPDPIPGPAHPLPPIRKNTSAISIRKDMTSRQTNGCTTL